MSSDKLAWIKTREKGLLKASTNGGYYYRLHAAGRQHWGSLHTTDFKIACSRLREKVKEIKGAGEASASVDSGRGTFGQLVDIFRATVKNDTSKKDTSKHYDKQQIAAIERTWPELAGMRIRDITKVCARTGLRIGSVPRRERNTAPTDLIRALIRLGTSWRSPLSEE
jgi:hypothetical protein